MSILNTIKKAQANMSVTTSIAPTVTTTQSTTKEATTMATPTIKTETTGFAPLNTNALSSTINAKLFLMMGDAMQSTVLACAVTDAITLVRSTGMDEAFGEFVLEAVEYAKLSTVHIEAGPLTKALAKKKLYAKECGQYYIPTKEELTTVREEKGTRTSTAYEVVLDEAQVNKTLGKLKMLNKDGTMGKVLVEMVEQRKEAYSPIPVGEKFTRKFKTMGLEKGQLDLASCIAVECIEAQEATQYSTDAYMLDIANQAQAKLGKLGFADKEEYVLAGCNAMNSDLPYTSEFKFDKRLRSYLASAYGPNGQASDRSRALMDLYGVPTDYNIKLVRAIVMAEVEDMVGGLTTEEIMEYIAIANADPVEFVVELLQVMKSERPIKKVWSFVKAARIIAELDKGNRPYIGMAVGLDAKCSGPQYGGLMAGDDNIVAACGFTLEQDVLDAYQRCIEILERSSFAGMSRNGIKKTFMGVFYGQGWAAFQNIEQMRKDEQFELVDMLLAGNTYISEERAKEFHKLVTSSFGTKMVYIRNQVAKFTNCIEGRMGHFMPDGAKVQMNYKVKENILGEAVEIDTVCPDVLVTINGTEFKFIKMTLKTKHVDSNNFVRTAFVNMIQAVDALIARLIMVHLSRLGAKHIVGVHDCFRVNVTEMHLLEKAVKLAYTDVFGSQRNLKTEDLPMGCDIMGMFFEGLNASFVEPAQSEEAQAILDAAGKVAPSARPEGVSQFTKSGIRRFQKCNGEYVHVLINKLGDTKYFAK